VEDQALTWRKASYSSGNGGACVEVASDRPTQTVAIRDTTNRAAFTLRIPSPAWIRFISSVR
jgi:hypothetical protein